MKNSNGKSIKEQKKLQEQQRNQGFSYNFRSCMCFPDNLSKPSRTIITSEGGATPSRFKKHVILQNKKNTED